MFQNSLCEVILRVTDRAAGPVYFTFFAVIPRSVSYRIGLCRYPQSFMRQRCERTVQYFISVHIPRCSAPTELSILIPLVPMSKSARV